MRVYESCGADETEKIAQNLAKELKPGDFVAYRGGLGAGKTAFTRGLAAGLGIDPAQVSSPTFAILNVYRGEIDFYHFDMYRIDGLESLYSTGFFDHLDSGGIFAAEWSENIADGLPENSVIVTITPTGGDRRRIEVEGGGGRF